MALTAPRNTLESEGRFVTLTVAAGATIHAGALVAANASGQAVPASDTAGLKVIGRAEENATAGNYVRVKRGAFIFENDGNITIANIGATATVADDETVSLAANTTNDIPAGKILDVTAEGVLVDTRFA